MTSKHTRLQLSRSEWLVTGFTTVYMGVATVAAAIGGNKEFIFYIVVMLILIALVITLHLKVGLAQLALWGLSFWGLAHMAGGLAEVPEHWPVKGDSHALYNLWLVPGLLKYDQLIHAYGFGLVTWICWLLLSKAIVTHDRTPRPTWGLLVLCAAAGMGFGALNEVVEFVATLTVPETNVGGYENTGWDLVANLTGTLIAAILIRIRSAGV